MEKIELTRAEIDALNKHNEKIKLASIMAVLDDVEEMIRERHRSEDLWSSGCENAEERGKFLHGRNVCESLIIGIKRIKERFEE